MKQDPELRAKMVRAAEELIAHEMRGQSDLSSTQLSRLISVCHEAITPEEIELYMKYQGGRSRAGLPLSFVDRTLEETKALFGGQGPEALGDWRRFVVFLKRAFVYHEAVNKDARGSGGQRRGGGR